MAASLACQGKGQGSSPADEDVASSECNLEVRILIFVKFKFIIIHIASYLRLYFFLGGTTVGSFQHELRC